MSLLMRPHYDKVHLSVRWDKVFVPFPPMLLVDILPRLNYVIPDQVTRQIGLRQQIQVDDGVIGRKASFSVHISERTNPGLGMSSDDPDGLVSEFTDVEDAIARELRYNSEENARFYEFTSNAIFPSSSNPIRNLHAHLGSVPIADEIGEIVGHPLSLYGVRLAPTMTDPNQIEWIDFRFEPAVRSASSFYHVDVVFRSASRTSVMDFAQNFEARVNKIVDFVDP